MNPADSPRPSIVTIAAVLSAGAGLVHATATGSHAGDTSLVRMFAACAVLQIGWAVAVLASGRPGRGLVLAGVGINLAIALGWVASRTTGISFVDSLAEREAVGTQDAIATVLEATAAIGAAASLWWRPALGRRVITGLAALAILPTTIAMVAPHDASHAEGHAHAEGTAASDHTDGTDHAAGTDHAQVDGGGHEHGSTSSGAVADPIFVGADVAGIPEAQLADAKDLVESTRESIAAQFTDIPSVEADGYRSIGDGRRPTGVVYEHFVKAEYLNDGRELDPAHIESLVFEVTDGVKRLSTAMYILESGSTMDDVPEIAGSLTTWHDHQNLCWDPATRKLSGIVIDGACFPGGVLRPTSPMLHVWLQDNECGPFAGVEGHASDAEATCQHHHDS